jgi:LemA protein
MGYAAIAVVVLIVLVIIGTYNRLVSLRQNVRESWSAIDTELRRRYDLIPNLVEVVKGYATHERETLENVVRARNSAISAVDNSPEAVLASEKALSGALRQVFALSEAYPDLKANQNFQALQAQLEETETRISQARRFYNANVRELNTEVESFPNVLVAGPLGFKAQTYFGIEDAAAYEPVKITGMLSEQHNDSSQAIKIPEKQKELE